MTLIWLNAIKKDNYSMIVIVFNKLDEILLWFFLNSMNDFTLLLLFLYFIFPIVKE